MGLDMYLTGEKHNMPDWINPENNQYEDGYLLQSRRFALGYWRKHPDLHGFIVENFAKSMDDCKPIHLDTEDIGQIMVAIKEDRLPHTEGFFFGESDNDDEQKAESIGILSIGILSRALQWLEADEAFRSVYYQASW